MKKLYFTLLIVLGFVISNAQTQPPNPSFESWTQEGTYENPDNWNTTNIDISGLVNENVTKQNINSQQGVFFPKMITSELLGSVIPGVISLGTIVSGTINGGIPYTDRPDILNGYFQYNGNNDTCGIEIYLTLWNGTSRDTIAHSLLLIDDTISTWTLFEIPISYQSSLFPDTINIIFGSSYSTQKQIGSELLIDNIHLVNIDTTIINEQICQGDTYDFYGTSLTNGGIYYHTLTSTITSCDSIIKLNLIANPSYDITDTVVVCGNSYTWNVNGQTYTSSTTVTENFYTINACDSIRHLDLTINPTYNIITDTAICDGESITWHGFTYSTAGTYTDNYVSIYGCDSIFTLNLTVNPRYNIITDTAICDGESITWHGFTYSTAGTYTDSYVSIYGCDSIFTLNLTVNPNPTQVVIIPNPSNGLLTGGASGQISLSTSFTGTNYWVTLGGAIFTNNIAGTGSNLNLGYNYIAGTYEVWSQNQYNCILKQGNVTFTDDNGTTKIVASATYGTNQQSFANNDVQMSLYKSTLDINNNTVIILEAGPTNLSSGNIQFDNLDYGDYYLKSEVVNPSAYPNVTPVYFYDGPTVDSADVITMVSGDIRTLNVNHYQVDTTGSNTGGGTVSGGGSKSINLVGLADQIVILRNQTTGSILSAVITDNNGDYYIDYIPDNENVQLYVTSFEYQNWTPANITTTTNTHYTVNFIAQGDSVYPDGTTNIENKEISKLDFSIYPNPTKNIVYFKNLPNNAKIKVFDSAGKLMISDIRSKMNSLDVSSLTNGTYIITVKTDNNKIGTRKLIIK